MENKVILTSEALNLPEYRSWLGQVVADYRNAQIKAAVRVNSVLLEFYWHLGRDITKMKFEQRWGVGVFDRLSLDLKEALPEQGGLSVTNLRYIKRWVLFYTNQPQVVADSQVLDFEELPDTFAKIPWGHHRYIISHCKSIDEAYFYINTTVSENWSRAQLQDAIKIDEYYRRGVALTNFSQTLPIAHGELAKEVLKDPYNFDFITLTQGYREKDLETELSKNITKFLLELGKGFAFVGQQVELIVCDKSYIIDMLFYHIKLKCYVVVELKVVDFEPEFAGKINFYTTAVDKLLKSKEENPTIGLLICKTKNNTAVEWSFDGINKPLGVASYELNNIISLKEQLPTVNEIEQQLTLTDEKIIAK